jgi:hypothetical protein
LVNSRTNLPACNSFLTVDSIYYPGVVACLEMAAKRPDFIAYAIFSAYPRRDGRYHYYGGEGYVDIYNAKAKVTMTENVPKDNGFGYEHQLFEWDPYVMLNYDNGNGLVYSTIDRFQTGPHTSLNLVQITSCPVTYKVHEF